jgi:hypothetical protein
MEEDPQALVDSSTRPELQERAKELGAAGTSRMNKRQLAEAIVERTPGEPGDDDLERFEHGGRQELEKLTDGPTVSYFGGELPVRAAVAIGVFALTFVACWMLLWALFDTIGFALGWLVAGAVATGAVKLTADWSARQSAS